MTKPALLHFDELERSNVEQTRPAVCSTTTPLLVGVVEWSAAAVNYQVEQIQGGAGHAKAGIEQRGWYGGRASRAEHRRSQVIGRIHTRIEKLEGLRPPTEHHYPERIYLRGMDWSDTAGVVPEAQPPLVMVCAERAGFFREMTEAELIEWKHEYDSPE